MVLFQLVLAQSQPAKPACDLDSPRHLEQAVALPKRGTLPESVRETALDKMSDVYTLSTSQAHHLNEPKNAILRVDDTLGSQASRRVVVIEFAQSEKQSDTVRYFSYDTKGKFLKVESFARNPKEPFEAFYSDDTKTPYETITASDPKGKWAELKGDAMIRDSMKNINTKENVLTRHDLEQMISGCSPKG